MARRYNVVVLGGGPAGASAAAETARRGLSTLLIDRDASGDRPRGAIGECLSPRIQPLLERAGVWRRFLRAGHSPSVGIRSIWGSAEPADRDFVFSPYGAGWHVDRNSFDAMLRDAAVSAGAEQIKCLALRDAFPGVSLDFLTPDGSLRVEADFVVDATGRPSVFARSAGAHRKIWDRLTGVAGYFQVSSAPEAALLVEAVESGWWYTAPLPQDRMIAVFLTDAAQVQREALMHPANWFGQLRGTAVQRRRLEQHGAVLDGPLRVVPAESSLLDSACGERWIAAGDAAAAYDPLSSQGILSAISSGLSAGVAAHAYLMGDTNAPLAHAAAIRKSYAEYLANRQIYYGIERRWPHSDFWRTRQGVATACA